jgi:hypothetical protein
LTYQKVDLEGSTAVRSGGGFKVEGKGMAEFTVRVAGGSIQKILLDSLHTPDFGMNLISLPTLDTRGFRGEWGNGRLSVVSRDGVKVVDGQIVRTGGRRKLYQVDVVDNIDGGSGSVIAAIAGRNRNQPTDLETWHRRFGHGDVRAIKRMADRSLVDGLNLLDRELRGWCEDCILGKQDKMPFDDVVMHENTPLQRVHLDLWGKARTPSWGHAIYMMLVSDGGTSMKFPLFLTDKTAATTLNAFTIWLTEAELQTGERLRRVRIDLGGEFDNNLFIPFCAKRGIIVEKIPKDSSSANGHVERGNRTVIEGTRTQLIEGNLDHRFWAESATAHCYVRGFIPSTRHPDVVPWAAWFRQKDEAGNLVKLNVSHLRAWGSVCWVKDLDGRQGKLGEQGWKGKMVGYMGRRGYRIFDPERIRIFEVRNVIFEEGLPHRTRINDEEETLPQDPALFDEPVRDAPIVPPIVPPVLAAPPAPTAAIPAPAPPPPPPPPRRSNRAPKPSEGQLRSMVSNQEEEQARLAGEDWARDSVRPSVNAVDVNWDEFDAALLQNPWAFASAIKGGRDESIPRSYREAMREPEKWGPAMRKEIDQLEARGVWKLVDLPKGKQAIDGMWVYDVKVDGEGKIIGHKGRYVVRGDEMVEGRDFGVKWAMVARMESVRMVFAVAAIKGLEVRQWDFSGAYLNGEMDRPVYMKQPTGFAKQGEEGKVCLLLRPLYGLVQAGHIWYKLLARGYKDLGYKESLADPCIRTRQRGDDYTLTTTHTDDVLGVSSSAEESRRVVDEFAAKWDLKEVDVALLLGLTVEKLADGSISLHQTQYFQKVLEHFGYEDLPPLSTPLPPGCQISASTSPLSPKDVAFMRDKPFRPILGTIVWGSSGTRPDLAYACCALGHVQSNPGPVHWDLLIGVLRYITGTLDYGVKYTPPANANTIGDGLKPAGYVDSDWAGCVDTRRSTSGYIFFMGGAPVCWSAKRQAVVALSSTEAEYISLARGAQHAIWMKNWLHEALLPQELPFTLRGDNLGSISLTETTKGHGLAKHIDTRWHYIRERVEAGEIAVSSIPGKDNVADILTKALPRTAHEKIVGQLGLDWKRRSAVRQGEC